MTDLKPLLVFSGGMDSSYMLWKELEKGDVYTCYIKATQCQDKIPMELAARKKIIKFFEKKTGNKVISDTIVDLGKMFQATERNRWGSVCGQWNNNIPDHQFSQALVWPFALQFATDGRKHSKVCLGYVMGDQFTMHLGDMRMAWIHTSNYARNHQVPMEFPLMYDTKDRILNELPFEIIPDLWICELPKAVGEEVREAANPLEKERSGEEQFVACEKCPACETWAKTVFIWERRKKLNLQDCIKERLAILANESREVTDVEGTNPHEADGRSTQQSGERGNEAKLFLSHGSVRAGIRDQRKDSEPEGVL